MVIYIKLTIKFRLSLFKYLHNIFQCIADNRINIISYHYYNNKISFLNTLVFEINTISILRSK